MKKLTQLQSNKILAQFVLEKEEKVIKKEINNILFPNWKELGLLGKIFRQTIRTKENPEGFTYEETEYQVVMRILGGKLYINNMVDAYTWTKERVNKYLSRGEHKFIGINSYENLMNLIEVIKSLKNEEDKLTVTDMFLKNNNYTFINVKTPAEERHVMIVDEEILKVTKGIVNEWDGCKGEEVDPTPIEIGDAIVITLCDNPQCGYTFYRIGRDEFKETYTRENAE